MASKPGEIKHPDGTAPALPAWKAFVLQLSQETTPDSGILNGRIEHLASGRRERFGSGKELLSVVMRMLRELGDSEKEQ